MIAHTDHLEKSYDYRYAFASGDTFQYVSNSRDRYRETTSTASFQEDDSQSTSGSISSESVAAEETSDADIEQKNDSEHLGGVTVQASLKPQVESVALPFYLAGYG